MSCGVGRRCGSDPALLWLWRRPAAAALIRSLAWEPPYVLNVALKKEKKVYKFWSSHLWLSGIHEDGGSIPGLAQWVKEPV